MLNTFSVTHDVIGHVIQLVSETNADKQLVAAASVNNNSNSNVTTVKLLLAETVGVGVNTRRPIIFSPCFACQSQII